MTRFLVPAMAGAMFLALNSSASAITKYIEVGASDITGPAGTSNAGGAALLNGGTQAFSFSFNLPANYKPNTPVKLILKMTPTSPIACSIYIVPDVVFRQRTGKDYSGTFASQNGLQPVVVDVPSGGFTGVQAVMTLTRSSEPPITDQLAGDHIYMTMARQSADPNDNCNVTVNLYTVKIVYTVK